MATANLVSRFGSVSGQPGLMANFWNIDAIEHRDSRSAKFELNAVTTARGNSLFDGVNITCNDKSCSRFAVYGNMNSGSGFRFDGVNIDCGEKQTGMFNIYGVTLAGGAARFDSILEITLPYGETASNRFDAFTPNPKVILASLFDAIEDRRPNVAPFVLAAGRFDVPFANLFRSTNRFDSAHDFESVKMIGARFDSIRDTGTFDATPFRFNIYEYILWSDSRSVRFDSKPPNPAARSTGLFDVIAQQVLAVPSRRQIFVKPGWTIYAKNIETDIVTPIGWIDADSETREIENVVLPEGNYEIIVTTSALFWKDAAEHVVRTISIRKGQVFSQLPVIYNLRSAVSFGETTVRWSAGPSDVGECVFGVWVSPTSSVETTVTPYMTIWYDSDLTEYQANVQQSTPMYAAIAAIRTGNEEEIGPVHEIFLNWSNEKPRAPDDAVVLYEPFPVFEPEEVEREEEGSELGFWP